MGMFDDVCCEAELPDDCPERDFQTKDFECAMTQYIISEDGRLLRKEFDREDVPDAVRPPFWNWINERQVEVPFHGVFRFYTGVVLVQGNGFDQWFEYEAKFTDGRLVSITRIEPGAFRATSSFSFDGRSAKP